MCTLVSSHSSWPEPPQQARTTSRAKWPAQTAQCTARHAPTDHHTSVTSVRVSQRKHAGAKRRAPWDTSQCPTAAVPCRRMSAETSFARLSPTPAHHQPLCDPADATRGEAWCRTVDSQAASVAARHSMHVNRPADHSGGKRSDTKPRKELAHPVQRRRRCPSLRAASTSRRFPTIR